MHFCKLAQFETPLGSAVSDVQHARSILPTVVMPWIDRIARTSVNEVACGIWLGEFVNSLWPAGRLYPVQYHRAAGLISALNDPLVVFVSATTCGTLVT